MPDEKYAKVKNKIWQGSTREGDNPIDLWPRECEFLLDKLTRLESLEQLIEYYKAEKRRLLSEVTECP